MTSRSTSRSVHLVVPVFNEAVRLADYFDELVAFITSQPPGSHLCFVDDGSTDGTAAYLEARLAVAEPPLATVLRRPHEGKGAAVQAGLLAGRSEIAAFCDVDLSTDLRDLERIIEIAGSDRALVIGSRALPDSRVVEHESSIREWLGRSYNKALRLAVTPGFSDTQCGAKAASMTTWRRLLPHCRQTGFAWDAEVVAVALAVGVEVHEIPVRWRHDPRTRVRLLRDGAAMLLETPRIMRAARAAARRPVADGEDGEHGEDGERSPSGSNLPPGAAAADPVSRWRRRGW
jgi:hypothetical protein